MAGPAIKPLEITTTEHQSSSSGLLLKNHSRLPTSRRRRGTPADDLGWGLPMALQQGRRKLLPAETARRRQLHLALFRDRRKQARAHRRRAAAGNETVAYYLDWCPSSIGARPQRPPPRLWAWLPTSAPERHPAQSPLARLMKTEMKKATRAAPKIPARASPRNPRTTQMPTRWHSCVHSG